MVDSCHYFSRTHSERCALDARRRGALAALEGWAWATVVAVFRMYR